MDPRSQLESPPDNERELPWVADPERRPIPGAPPTISGLALEADASWRAACQQHATGRFELHRRGQDHGELHTFDPKSEARADLPRRSRTRQLFREARPFVVKSAARSELREWRNELHRLESARGKLMEPGGLERFARMALGRDAGGFVPVPDPTRHDPERDLERLLFHSQDTPDAELWAKTGRLSTHPEDQSLRLRLGFGEEGLDDDSNDPRARRALARLAARLFPVRAPLFKARLVADLLQYVDNEPLEPGLDIMYWNRPDGGALFHHDAHSDATDGQRGVLYTQLAGSTAWLALSIGDLASRVVEFAEIVGGSSAPWLLELWVANGTWAVLEELVQDRGALIRELGLPGAGRLSEVVNRGPEFTGYLADVGHACVLEAGDALLLPNHGRLSTAMHSVFCASPSANLGLSTALWRSRPGRSGRRRR